MDPSLRVLFPPPGAELVMDGAVLRRVMGGRRPIRYLVDGAARPVSRTVNWLPSGPRFYTLSAIDADGLTDHVSVRVR